MADLPVLEEFLSGGHVDAAVYELRPDYRAMLLAVDGIVPGPSDQASDALLQAAEAAAAEALRDRPVDQVPHVAAWREAYRAFGAKPQRTRNSLEALLRRATSGLPRLNRLTDVYNAVSVLHQIPLGGEDLTRYAGAPQLGPPHPAHRRHHHGVVHPRRSQPDDPRSTPTRRRRPGRSPVPARTRYPRRPPPAHRRYHRHYFDDDR